MCHCHCHCHCHIHCFERTVSFWFSICAFDLHAWRSHAMNLLLPVAHCWPVGALQSCVKVVIGKIWQASRPPSACGVKKTDPSERPKTSLELCKYPHRTISMNKLQSVAQHYLACAVEADARTPSTSVSRCAAVHAPPRLTMLKCSTPTSSLQPADKRLSDASTPR